MATRSFIAVQTIDGNYKDIYCHNDGYLSHNGLILLAYYHNYQRIMDLMELGDLSYLASRISEINPPEYSDNETMITFAYGRDRGDSNTECMEHTDITKLRFDEYAYLYKDSKWYYRTEKNPEYQLLTFDLCEK